MMRSNRSKKGVRAGVRSGNLAQSKKRSVSKRNVGNQRNKSRLSIPKERFDTWVLRHLQVMFGSLGRLTAQPVSSLLTATVIGIALALPTSMFLLVDNARDLVTQWQSQGEIWLYMKPEVSDLRASQIAADLESRVDVSSARLITRDQAKELFVEHSNLSSAMELLDNNPLPAAIVLTPSELNAAVVDGILWHVREMPQVDLAKTDREWIERLQAIIDLARRVVMIIILGLFFGVAIIVGNTIRLDIENHRQEIIVIKLVGGTDGFVRRPFLYVGFWYGIAGGVLALMLVGIMIGSLQGPFNEVLGLFESGYELAWLTLGDCLRLIGIGMLLGWLGSWFGVAKHLKEIEPT